MEAEKGVSSASLNVKLSAIVTAKVIKHGTERMMFSNEKDVPFGLHPFPRSYLISWRPRFFQGHSVRGKPANLGPVNLLRVPLPRPLDQLM